MNTIESGRQRYYKRDEILGILQEEGTPLSMANLRKAIARGMIPRPRRVSTGKAKLHFEYSETALEHARLIARLLKGGQSMDDVKKHIGAVSIKKMAVALTILEQIIGFHEGPHVIAKHACLLLQEVVRINHGMPADIQAWLSGLPSEVAGIAAIGGHNLAKNWMAWIARTRSSLERFNFQLRAHSDAEVGSPP